MISLSCNIFLNIRVRLNRNDFKITVYLPTPPLFLMLLLSAFGNHFIITKTVTDNHTKNLYV